MQLSRRTIWILLAIWALAIGLSCMSLLEPAAGSGFTRGINRLTGFLSWQMAAAVAALILWFGVRDLPSGDVLRRLGRIPGWWSLGLLAVIVALFAYGFLIGWS
jgi:hypothetical protein